MQHKRTFSIVLAFLFGGASLGLSQTVYSKDGNVYFVAREGQVTGVTNLGLDLDPSLSNDGRLVVFVRRTPSLKIQTALGKPTDRNELWVADTLGKEPARRVLAGYPAGQGLSLYQVTSDVKLDLAGFSSPQFSPDAKRIYFMGEAWATSLPAFVLDLSTGRVEFLYNGRSIEVIRSGRYAGFLIAEKQIPRVVAGRVFRYWLLDPNGKDVGEIGVTKAELSEFRGRVGDP